MLSSRALLAFTSLLGLAAAQQQFTYPQAGDTLEIGEEISITWTVDRSINEVGLSICNAFGNAQRPDCVSIGGGIKNVGSYDWTPRSSLRAAEGYYLVMTADTTAVTASELFEIGGEGSSPSSTSGPSTSGPTSGSPTTSGGSPTTSGGSDQTGSNTPTPIEDGGSSNGTIIGAAVGAVVVVIIIAIAGFLFMRKKNQRKLAEARGKHSRGNSDEDLEGGIVGAGGKNSNRSSLNTNPAGAAHIRPRNNGKNGADVKKKEAYGAENGGYMLAELPAMQQEPVEMMAAPAGSSTQPAHFFAMELDSREIPRPGTASNVKPDVETSAAATAASRTPTRPENRGISIDGTTVNSETDRPKTSGTIEGIKEENSREAASSSTAAAQRSATPVQQAPAHPAAVAQQNGRPPARDSTPQIRNSIPRLPAFEFDSSRF